MRHTHVTWRGVACRGMGQHGTGRTLASREASKSLKMSAWLFFGGPACFLPPDPGTASR